MREDRTVITHLASQAASDNPDSKLAELYSWYNWGKSVKTLGELALSPTPSGAVKMGLKLAVQPLANKIASKTGYPSISTTTKFVIACSDPVGSVFSYGANYGTKYIVTKFGIEHPELKAAMDIVALETANTASQTLKSSMTYQATKKAMKSKIAKTRVGEQVSKVEHQIDRASKNFDNHEVVATGVTKLRGGVETVSAQAKSASESLAKTMSKLKTTMFKNSSGNNKKRKRESVEDTQVANVKKNKVSNEKTKSIIERTREAMRSAKDQFKKFKKITIAYDEKGAKIIDDIFAEKSVSDLVTVNQLSQAKKLVDKKVKSLEQKLEELKSDKSKLKEKISAEKETTAKEKYFKERLDLTEQEYNQIDTELKKLENRQSGIENALKREKAKQNKPDVSLGLPLVDVDSTISLEDLQTILADFLAENCADGVLHSIDEPQEISDKLGIKGTIKYLGNPEINECGEDCIELYMPVSINGQFNGKAVQDIKCAAAVGFMASGWLAPFCSLLPETDMFDMNTANFSVKFQAKVTFKPIINHESGEIDIQASPEVNEWLSEIPKAVDFNNGLKEFTNKYVLDRVNQNLQKKIKQALTEKLTDFSNLSGSEEIIKSGNSVAKLDYTGEVKPKSISIKNGQIELTAKARAQLQLSDIDSHTQLSPFSQAPTADDFSGVRGRFVWSTAGINKFIEKTITEAARKESIPLESVEVVPQPNGRALLKLKGKNFFSGDQLDVEVQPQLNRDNKLSFKITERQFKAKTKLGMLVDKGLYFAGDYLSELIENDFAIDLPNVARQNLDKDSCAPAIIFSNFIRGVGGLSEEGSCSNPNSAKQQDGTSPLKLSELVEYAKKQPVMKDLPVDLGGLAVPDDSIVNIDTLKIDEKGVSGIISVGVEDKVSVPIKHNSSKKNITANPKISDNNSALFSMKKTKKFVGPITCDVSRQVRH